jgi:hypothetical protein
VEWSYLQADFDADFRRLSHSDVNRMELSRAGDEAVAKGDVAGMTAANGVYTSCFHSLKGSYQELLLQKEKAKKRASAGGSVAGEDTAASSLVFELADLLFRVFCEQWDCFKAQRQGVLLSLESRNSADAGAEPEKEKSDSAKRKNKPKKGEVRKYYAVAVAVRAQGRGKEVLRGGGRQEDWSLHYCRQEDWSLHYLGRSGSLR